MDNRTYRAVIATAWHIAEALGTIDLDELALNAERQGSPADRALVRVLQGARDRLPRNHGPLNPRG